MLRTAPRVGVFRPVARGGTERDYVLDLLLHHDGVDFNYEECIGVSYEEVHRNPDAALETILERYQAVARKADAMIIVGSDYTDVTSPTEFSFNARVAANLGAPVLLVVGGRDSAEAVSTLTPVPGRPAGDIARVIDTALAELRSEHAEPFGVVVNRAEPEEMAAVTAAASEVVAKLDAASPIPVWVIPEDRLLIAPTMQGIAEVLGAEQIAGDADLVSRDVLGAVVAGMTLENVLTRLIEGAVVLIPGDRSEVLLGVLMAQNSETFPRIAGIVLYGGFPLAEPVARLMAGTSGALPVLTTGYGTYDTVLRITRVRGRLAADSQRKFDTALALFEQHVDLGVLTERLELSKADAVTPLMFEYGLIERARSDRRRIVLPEGNDARVLRAAATLLRRGVVDLTILGEPAEVQAQVAELGLDLAEADIVSPFDPDLRERFAAEYARLRAHKGVTLDQARDTVVDVSYFGTMMVQQGLADGMVSGAAHTTAHTIRPSFEVIKTVPDVDTVSSVFLMALADRVLVYGDCAVVPDPTVEQLADIAISSAQTAAQFGIEPRIAMLSYSTGESGSGADVDKVRAATELVRQRRPDLLVEGPIQYDAAVDPSVAATKLPNSQVAGRATVLIFPDLNTGNNTYKAVQRTAGAVAIGPVLQGLRKPVNDLSRGALVRDIVNTVAITAVQAQSVPSGPLHPPADAAPTSNQTTPNPAAEATR